MKHERSASSVGNHFTTEKAEVSQAGTLTQARPMKHSS